MRSGDNMLRAVASAFIFSAVLSGCATPREYTPTEFRDAMRNGKSSMWGSLYAIETYDAPRSYPQLTAMLRRKSKECLDVTVQSSGMVKHGAYWVRETSRTDYKPILTAEKGKTELTVQGGVHNVYGLDAEPAGKNSTRLTVYRAKMGVSNAIHQAVQGWVKGDAMTCPKWNG